MEAEETDVYSMKLDKAIKEGDVSLIVEEYLNEYHSVDTENPLSLSAKAFKKARDYIYDLLAPMAENSGIDAEEPEEIGEVEKIIEGALLKLKKAEETRDLDLLEEVKADLEYEGADRTRRYVAQFVCNTHQLESLIKNPKLKSETRMLLERFEAEDIICPLDKPMEIDDGFWDWSSWAEGGESSFSEENTVVDEGVVDFGNDGNDTQSYRLETEEEMKERVARTLKARAEMLEKAKSVDVKADFKKWWSFITYLPEVAKTHQKAIDEHNKAFDLKNKIKLEQFKDDKEFYSALLKIMQHGNDCKYWYHGTQGTSTAESIMKDGLLLAQDLLTTTAYSEFKPDQLLIYERGFGGEIGGEGVIIFKQPYVLDADGNKVPENIIKENDTDIKVFASGQGIQWDNFEYKIPPEYIVGFVDKVHHKIIYNPKCMDFNNENSIL